jgi:hypothetical protein
MSEEGPKQAAAILEADKQSRAKEYGEILTKEGQRLNCDLVAVAEIVGSQVSTRVVIIPK